VAHPGRRLTVNIQPPPPMELVSPLHAIGPCLWCALYAKLPINAALHGKAGDVFEMIEETFSPRSESRAARERPYGRRCPNSPMVPHGKKQGSVRRVRTSHARPHLRFGFSDTHSPSVARSGVGFLQPWTI